MGRLTAPESLSAEIPGLNSERFDGSNNLASDNGPSYQLDPSSALVPGPEPVANDGCQEMATESPTLIGRPDIDEAMLDALRHATVSDHGFPGPGWVAPDRGQLEVVRQTTRHGGSMSGPSPLVRRPDIDEAMLDALRNAIVSDPRFPDG
jgi:hypothetical protein